MIDTPRTDEAAFVASTSGGKHDVVTVEFAEQLKRELIAATSALSGRTVSCSNCNALSAENAHLRDAIKEAYKLVRWLSHDTTGLQFRTANSALSILQPYLK
jgi:hypothetical protein